MQVDLLVHGAGQLISCASPGGPKRGAAMADVGLISDGALAVKDGIISAVGTSSELRFMCEAGREMDLDGRVICPGLVDAHTHVVYAGDRIAEFEMRIQGASYMQIMEAGGGIVSTMEATRAATVEELAARSRPRLDAMLALGTTTAEVKTGYGLDVESELKMLEAIAVLNGPSRIDGGENWDFCRAIWAHPIDLVPTFLGAHAVPPEYQGRQDDYLELVIGEMLPAAANWYRESPFAKDDVPFFCDVFCEQNVFSREQSERVLQAGLALGLPAKIHADEFVSLGGAALAAKLGAVSADHLDVTPWAEIRLLAESDTVGVLLPAVNLNLGGTRFAPARAMIDAGMAVALATDINPGSAPCPSLPLVMGIACRYQGLLPAEAFNACSINAAHALGMGQRVGSIEPGKQADLLILDAEDYRQLSYELGSSPVSAVIKRGQLVSRSDETAL